MQTKHRNAARIKRDESSFNAAPESHNPLQAIVASLGLLLGNSLANLVTIVIIAIALAFPTSIYVLLQNVRSISNSWNKGTQITLYLKQNVHAEKAEALAKKLQSDPNVLTIKYISAAEGLKEFQNTSGLGDIITELEENPLPAVLLVQPKASIKSEADITQLAGTFKQLPEVASTQVDAQWVKRLASFTNLGFEVILVFFVFLIASLILIISNTVSLSTHFALHQISTTKKFTGSKKLMHSLFLYNGIWCGLFGSLGTWAIVETALWWLKKPVHELALTYGSNFELHGLVWNDILILIGIGMVLGLLGAWLGVSKHARKSL